MESEKIRGVDRRTRRTKQRLLQGLVELMKVKHFRDISVRELSELADINRGTFYLYYRDIFDMLNHVEAELLGDFENIFETHVTSGQERELRPFLTDLFGYIGDNGDLFRVLLSRNGDIAFLQKIIDIVRDRYRKRLRELRRDELSEAEFDYRYSFSVFGGIGLIHCWLERDCAESPEEMALLAERRICSKKTPGA